MRRLRASHPGLEFSGVGAGQVLSRPIAHPKATAKANVRRPASIKPRRTTRFTAQLEQRQVLALSFPPREGMPCAERPLGMPANGGDSPRLMLRQSCSEACSGH
jgi:hypothetical protein